MTYRTDHHQRVLGVHDTAVELWLNTERRANDFKAFAGTATLTLRCGPVTLQTYPTAEELRSLAYAALKAALDLVAIERENDVMPVGEAREFV
jgi:hypothetical protein